MRLAVLLLLVLPVGATRAQSASPAALEAARAHASTLALAEGLSAADVADLVVTDATVSPRSGVTSVYLRQRVHGLEVEGTEQVVAVDAAGEVVHHAGQRVRGVGALPAPAPALSSEGAVAAAASLVGAPVPARTAARTAGSADQAVTFDTPESALAPLRAWLAFHADTTGAVRLVWVVGPLETTDAAGPHAWVVRVDAATGAEVARADWITRCDFGPAAGHAHAPGAPHAPAIPRAVAGPWASDAPPDGAGGVLGNYRVIARPAESPNHTATPGTRTLVTDPHDTAASPYGWHDTDGVPGPEAAITAGNNVHAYTDTNADNLPDPGSSPNGGGTLTFSFPLDLAQAPSTYRPATVTNLFYWNNVAHDILYRYGFDSPSGNFQVHTYGRGGVGGDDVRAEAQDGGGTDNAYFATPPDGSRPRMQMYEWTYTTPRRDSGLDAGVIVHEYAHGLSSRLVGGPANVECLGNDEQMGEGWSDWYGLMLTQTAADTREQQRGLATYLLGQDTDGRGLRPAPYSTRFAYNDYTYQDTRSGLTVPHGVGFVWATILWDITWSLIDDFGFSPDVYDAEGTAGNQIALNLVTEAMRHTPCNPGFVDARDAILFADAVLYPSGDNPLQGRHRSLLWSAFARRGLGASASQGSTASNGDNTEAFDIPLPGPNAVLLAETVAATLGPNQQTTRTLLVRNTAPTGSQDLRFTAAPAFDPLGGLDGSTVGNYTWADSRAPAGTPGRPTYAWTDIRSSGIRLLESGGDDGSVSVSFPDGFRPPFFGESDVVAMTVSTNGLLVLSGPPGTGWEVNTGLPNTSPPNAVVAPFWDDLYHFRFETPESSIHYLHDQSNDRLIVQWTDMRRVSEPNSRFTFQAILYATGRIEFVYHTMTGTLTSATVGLENLTGQLGLQIARNTSFAASGLAVRIEPGWLTLAPSEGRIPPGGSALVTLAFDGRNVPNGTFDGTVLFRFNDPDTPLDGVPISMTVEGRSVEIAGNAGWRMLAPPFAITVATLAGQNLVQGVPGYYPEAGSNLYTNYDGTSWVSASGGSESLPRGSGLIWYMWPDAHTPGGPSTGVALPMTLTAPGVTIVTDVTVPLHRAGDRWNLVGNPYAVGLNLWGLSGWAQGGSLGSALAQVWDPNAGSTGSYRLFGFGFGLPAYVAPWQGFFVQNSTATSLLVPTSARTDSGVFLRHDTETRHIAFTLTGADAATGAPVRDEATVLGFHPDAGADADGWDADKLAPLATAYAVAAFGGTDANGATAWRALESRAFDATSFEVPLFVEAAGTAPALTLSWPQWQNVPDDWHVTLRDLATGTVTDLRQTDQYTFSVAPTAAAPAAGPSADGRPLLPPVVHSQSFATSTPRLVLSVETGVVVAGDAPALPERLVLHAPVPNPTAGTADVRFDLPRAGDVRVEVFDVMGRRVAVLASGDHPAGRHAVRWDGGALAAGAYLVRLSAADGVIVQRATVVR